MCKLFKIFFKATIIIKTINIHTKTILLIEICLFILFLYYFSIVYIYFFTQIMLEKQQQQQRKPKKNLKTTDC